MKRLFQVVDSKGKSIPLFDGNDVPIENAFETKKAAKVYRQKVDSSFASFVTYGPDHEKYKP